MSGADETTPPASSTSAVAFGSLGDLSPCLAHVAAARASLMQIEDQLDVDDAQEALHKIVSTADELQSVFEFIDALERSVASAGELVEATERRLEVLERGEPLPDSLAQLPPPMFNAHQFTRQLRRREKAAPLDLPELVVLAPSRSSRGATQGAGAGMAAGAGASIPTVPASVAEASVWAQEFLGRAEGFMGQGVSEARSWWQRLKQP